LHPLPINAFGHSFLFLTSLEFDGCVVSPVGFWSLMSMCFDVLGRLSSPFPPGLPWNAHSYSVSNGQMPPLVPLTLELSERLPHALHSYSSYSILSSISYVASTPQPMGAKTLAPLSPSRPQDPFRGFPLFPPPLSNRRTPPIHSSNDVSMFPTLEFSFGTLFYVPHIGHESWLLPFVLRSPTRFSVPLSFCTPVSPVQNRQSSCRKVLAAGQNRLFSANTVFSLSESQKKRPPALSHF